MVEVTSHIRKGGFNAGFEVPAFPESCVSLITAVKNYERTLVDGFMKGDKYLIIEGMKQNPLIKSDKAAALLERIIKCHAIPGVE